MSAVARLYLIDFIIANKINEKPKQYQCIWLLLSYDFPWHNFLRG